MYTLKLGLWERIQLNMCLPRNVPWVEMEQLVRILKTIALSDEEKDSIGFEEIKVQAKQGGILDALSWDTKKLAALENLREFKFKAADFARLKADADAWALWPTDERSLALKAKMEAAVED